LAHIGEGIVVEEADLIVAQVHQLQVTESRKLSWDKDELVAIQIELCNILGYSFWEAFQVLIAAANYRV